MKIIESSENLTAGEVYLLTNNPKSRKMSDARGETIPLCKWCIFEDVNKKTGELQELLAIDTGDEVYCTNSATFISSFRSGRELYTQFGSDVTAIEIIEGQSKAGRTFIDCVIAN